MYQGVIFDLDGTLINSLEDLARSCNTVLEELGLPTHSIDSYRFRVGNGIGKLVERSLPEDKQDLYFQALARFKEIYRENAMKYTKVYPQITEVLETLEAKGYPLGICTNKHQEAAEALAEHFFGNKFFDILMGDTADSKRKPNPEKVLKIADIWDIEPKDILYLGDSDVDMQTAVNAGMVPVGVLWGFRPEEELVAHGAKILLQEPKELLELFK